MKTNSTSATRLGKVAPNLPANFLLGNIRQLQKDPLAFMTKAAHTHGDVVRYRLAQYGMFTSPFWADHTSV